MERSRDGKDVDTPMHWLRAAVYFAGEADAASLRRIEWLVVGNAVAFIYLIAVSPPALALSGLDQLILFAVTASTAVLWQYETWVMQRAARMTRHAIRGYLHLFGDSGSPSRAF